MLLDLPEDVLHNVISRLSSTDLQAVACVCKALKCIAGDGVHWQRLCTRRWARPAESLYSSASNSWRATYLDENGNGQSKVIRSTCFEGGQHLFIRHMSVSKNLGGTHLLLCRHEWFPEGYDVWEPEVASCVKCYTLDPDWPNAPKLSRDPSFSVAFKERDEPWTASLVRPGCMAVGLQAGKISLYTQPTSEENAAAEAEGSRAKPRRAKTIRLQCSNPISELMSVDDGATLWAANSAVTPAVYFDAVYRGVDRERCRLWSIDVETSKAEACQDIFPDYDLITICEHPSSRGVAIGAGRHSQVCERCVLDRIGWTCEHESVSRGAAHTAILGVFDMRAPSMVQRFNLQHRSLQPRLVTAPSREHYVFMSHATAPLSVWDLRRMTIPVHESGRLNNHPSDALFADGLSLKLPRPRYSVTNQSLVLTATADVLLGQALNGMVWQWDLSQTLGWADRSKQGCWERFTLASDAEEGEWAHPAPLGMIVPPHSGCFIDLIPDCDRMAFFACMDESGLPPHYYDDPGTRDPVVHAVEPDDDAEIGGGTILAALWLDDQPNRQD